MSEASKEFPNEKRHAAIKAVLNHKRSAVWESCHGQIHLFLNSDRESYELHCADLDKQKENGKITLFRIDSQGFISGESVFLLKEKKLEISDQANTTLDFDTLLTTYNSGVRKENRILEAFAELLQIIRFGQTRANIQKVYDLSSDTSLVLGEDPMSVDPYSSEFAKDRFFRKFNHEVSKMQVSVQQYVDQHGTLPEKLLSQNVVSMAAQAWLKAQTNNHKSKLSFYFEGAINQAGYRIGKGVDERALKEFRKLFIEEVLKDPTFEIDERDRQAILANAESCDPDLRNEIMLIGGRDEKVITYGEGKKEKVYRLYGSNKVIGGGFSAVVLVHYLAPGEVVLQKAALKIAEPDFKEKIITPNLGEREVVQSAQIYLVFEDYMAERFTEIAAFNTKDLGAAALLQPIARGENFMLLPYIQNEKGRSQDLHSMLGKNHNAKYVHHLGDVAFAYDLLSRNEIIPIDGKPANIMDQGNQAVLIDLAAFVDINDPKVVLSHFITQGQHIENNEAAISRVGTNNGLQAYAHDPSTTDLSLIVMEFEKKISSGTAAKLNLGMMVALLLAKNGFIDEDFLENFKTTPNSQKKDIQPPPLLNGKIIPPEIHELYDLFVKLFIARDNPYPSTPEGEKNKDYISLKDAGLLLHKLSITGYFKK